MELGTFTYADVGILAVLLISGLIALVRGFVKELLHILCWIAAAVIAVKGFEYVQPHVVGYLQPEILADIATAVGLFITSLVILVIITTMIARKVRKSEIGTFDRVLGFGFGLVRGVLLLALAYLVVIQFLAQDAEEQPNWFRESRAMPLVAESARVLTSLAPEVFAKAQDTIREAGESASEVIESGARDIVSDAPQTTSPGGGKNAEAGYDRDKREEMDQLIESRQ